MTIEAALRAYLLGVSAITTKVADRIQPQTLDQGTRYPAISYFVVANPIEESHGGNSELAHPLFQVNCWAKEYLEAKTLAREVRRALQDFPYPGLMGGPAGVEVDGVDFNGGGGRDVYDDELKIHGVQLDFTLWHYDA